MRTRPRARLSPLACEVWALVLGALALEALAGALSPGREPSTWPVLVTLFALQLVVQLCAALYLAPVRAVAALPGARALGAPLLAALVAGVALHPVAVALTSGAFIRTQPYAGALRVALAGGGALVLGLLAWLSFTPRLLARPRARLGLGLLLALAAAGGTFAHVHVHPGQYAEAHLVLLGAAGLCAHIAALHALSALTAASTRAAALLHWGAAPLVAAALAALASQLPPAQVVAAQLVLTSPRSGPLLALFPAQSPTELLDALRAADLREPYRPRAAQPAGFSLPRDFNLVLVVVDSLRADALPPALHDLPEPRFAPSDAPFLHDLAARSFRFRRVYTSATYTYLAMPAMFQSEQPLESHRRGAPLGVLMSEHGRTPVAVVNDFFAQPIDDQMAQLLSGFADVRTYSEHAQHEQRPLTEAALAQVKDQPFFAWLHYYGAHWPGWDGKAIPRNAKAWPENYKRGLHWVDGEIRWLFQLLQKLGVADRTAVVITADHGEGLGDTGTMFHGPFVYEEAVRVPLLIHVPGRSGKLIEPTVGTIDLVPTLLELAGGKPRFAHRGKSLVPLMTAAQSHWDESYFFMSGNERQVGAVRGRHKHILDRKTHAHLRFDVARDPREDDNLFEARDPAHRALQRELVQQFPQIFTSELRGTRAARLLDQQLAQASARTPPRALPFLLRAIAALPSESRLRWARRVFESAASDEVKLVVVDALHAHDAEGFGRLLERHLARIAGSAREAPFVTALADIGIGPFARDYVLARLRAQLDAPREQWLPWLRLVCDWPHAGAAQLEPLRRLAERFAGEAAPPGELDLRILLRALAHAKLRSVRNGPLAEALVRWLDHPSLGIQADAARALGRTGIKAAESLLRERLRSRPLIVRLAALEGLTDLLGDRAVPLIRELGKENEVSATAVRLAAALRSPAGLLLLDELEQQTRSRFVRANARKARVELERQLARPTTP